LYFRVPPYLLTEGAAGGLLTGGGAVGTAGVVEVVAAVAEVVAGAELEDGAGAGVFAQALTRKDEIRTTIARISNHFLT
jgi:hypothetical protein